MAKKIVIARDHSFSTGADLISDVGQLRAEGWRRFLRQRLLRFREASMLVNTLDANHLSLKACIALRLLSHGRAWFEDADGNRQAVNWSMMIQVARRWLRDYLMTPGLLANIDREVSQLEQAVQEVKGDESRQTILWSASAVYLRTDLVFGVRAGGSVGHIAGVLNQLKHFTGTPIFLTSDVIPTTSPAIATRVIEPEPIFLNNSELASLRYNTTFIKRALQEIGSRPVSFVYQRYSGNNYCGILLARHLSVPLVLEYNGSEGWVSRNWGEPRRYEAITNRIEMLNMNAADVVVVVSRALEAELVARGVEPAKILVNPNGVDQHLYSPEVDPTEVRARYDLAGKTVFGFIGTFGRWHGIEILVEAFARFVHESGVQRESARLMLIGDGSLMGSIQAAIDRHRIRELVILTGLVPQAAGPAYLAACDILMSPHVPNPDGSAFFGSPTKLFEYMAMGRGIVASRLDQIAEVLDHDRSAWLVEPGDVSALVAGMGTLFHDPALRERLATAARKEVIARYTWQRHTERIVDHLAAMYGRTRTQAA